jgi:hypothetical protein
MITLTSPHKVNRIAFAFSLLIVLPLAWAGLTEAKPPVTKSTQYDRGVNETLDTIMWVEDQAKAEHKKLTWSELNQRVCQEMRVRRTQPWDRR